MSRSRDRFVGHIAGLGTTAGPTLVLGHWPTSPFGAFADVMVTEPDGGRLLLAPTDEIAGYVAATYGFDRVEVHPVTVSADGPDRRWTVRAGPLDVWFRVGGRRLLGLALQAVPRPVATSPRWAGLLDPVARTLLPGVRTAGTAGQGRREWYGATDCHRIVAAGGRWAGVDVGGLRPVDPPVTFGFGSVPRTPSLTAVTTTVER